LLFGQAAGLGILETTHLACVVTLFLESFGAEDIPYVYVTLAVIAPIVASLFSFLRDRWSLAAVTLAATACGLVMLLSLWAGVRAGLQWPIFALMISNAIMLILLNIALTSQTSVLFDVRESKTKVPLIWTGRVIAVLLTGLAIAPMRVALGSLHDLILVGCGALVLFLVLQFLATRKPLGGGHAQNKRRSRRTAQPPLLLVRKPYIASLFAYGLLASLTERLIIFLFLTAVQARYVSEAEIASFMGVLLACSTVCSFLFVICAGGPLLRRFGLRFGLVATPITILPTILLAILAGGYLGFESGLAFVLFAACRFLNITLNDGSTETALRTSYQALPEYQREGAAALAKGFGGPIGIGISGILLLLFVAAGIPTAYIAGLTWVVSALWLASGLIAYRGYGAGLQNLITRIPLGSSEMPLPRGSSFLVVERMIASSDPTAVERALQVLRDGQHHSYQEHVRMLCGSDEDDLVSLSMRHLEAQPQPEAEDRIVAAMRETRHPATRSAAIRAYCALKEAEAIDQVAMHLETDHEEVRLGALVGLLRYCSISGALLAGQRLMSALGSVNVRERVLAAKATGAVEQRNFYEPLLVLMKDSDEEVRTQAIRAAARVAHPRLIPGLIENLQEKRLRALSLAALAAMGKNVLPTLSAALAGNKCPERVVKSLLRTCVHVEEGAVIETLEPHIDHPDDNIRTDVLKALNALGYSSAVEDVEHIETVRRREAVHGLRVLRARLIFEADAAAESLLRSLSEEMGFVQERLLLLLSFNHDADSIRRAWERLQSSDQKQQAIARESLDVILTRKEKILVSPLVDGSLSDRQRVDILSGLLHGSSGNDGPTDKDAQLLSILNNAYGQWTHEWTRVCAIEATRAHKGQEVAQAITRCLTDNAPELREAALWRMRELAAETFPFHADKMLSDPDAGVAQTASNFIEGKYMLPTIEKVNILKTSRLFTETPDHVLGAMANIAEEVEYVAGSKVIEEGAIEDHMFIILFGKVRIHKGQDTITMFGPGEVIGELAVFDAAARSASATAVEDAMLLRIEGPMLMDAMAEFPEIAVGALRELTRRLRQKNNGG